MTTEEVQHEGRSGNERQCYGRRQGDEGVVMEEELRGGGEVRLLEASSCSGKDDGGTQFVGEDLWLGVQRKQLRSLWWRVWRGE